MGKYYILETSMIARSHCRKRRAVLSGVAGGLLLLLAACSPQPIKPRLENPAAPPTVQPTKAPEPTVAPQTAFHVTHAPPAAAPQVPASSPLAVILAASARDYRQGEAYYQAGALDSARRKFNRAIDRLLTAPATAAGSPALHAALRPWRARIHALEMVFPPSRPGPLP